MAEMRMSVLFYRMANATELLKHFPCSKLHATNHIRFTFKPFILILIYFLPDAEEH